MKKGMLLLTVAVLVLGLSAMAVHANEKTGVVKSVDLKARTVTVTVARDMVFTVTDATKVVQGDQAKTLADIKVGAKVHVEYENAGETRTASKITILEEPAAK
jgi:Cu/Ag efflux protein CusF